jgi:formimidoylglutamate deiminase
LPIIVFALNRSAIRDVVVNGRFILRDQKHVLQDEIISHYKEIHHKVWQNSRMGAVRENGC